MERIKDLNLIFKAILFAIDKHEGQIRKDAERSPYITHPLLVAQALLEIGDVQDLPTLIAAILHDTLEDTKTTMFDIGKP